MNDTLQGVLAELASSLGTSTGELWAWLQGDGIREYAKVQVAMLSVQAVGFGVAMLATALVMAYIWRRVSRDPYAGMSELMVNEAVPGVTLLVLGAFETCVVSDLVCWMASPEGMVLMKVMEVLQR